MALVCLGLSHHTAPVTVRERFALAESHLPETMAALKATGFVEEIVILSTCNRVELYAVTSLVPAAAFAELESFLVKSTGYSEPLSSALYRLAEPQSVEHLFRVASGLDSMVLGETEILGQLKQAYQIGRAH